MPIDLGFLQATNNHRLKFAFMWANHDWLEIQPYKRGTPPKLLFPARSRPAGFERICDHVIKDYFQQPSYWRINGRPYFSFYELTKLLESFGSVEATRAALDQIPRQGPRRRTAGTAPQRRGLGAADSAGREQARGPAKLVRDLGFDSVTSYVWVHHVPLPDKSTDYNDVRDEYFKPTGTRREKLFGVPYFPNVTHGLGSQSARGPGGRVRQFRLSVHQHHRPATRRERSARRWRGPKSVCSPRPAARES